MAVTAVTAVMAIMAVMAVMTMTADSLCCRTVDHAYGSSRLYIQYACSNYTVTVQ